VAKATERGEGGDGLIKLRDLAKGTSEQSPDLTDSFSFLEKTLSERKDLSVKLEQAEKEK
jgi:hypothetical protein